MKSVLVQALHSAPADSEGERHTASRQQTLGLIPVERLDLVGLIGNSESERSDISLRAEERRDCDDGLLILIKVSWRVGQRRRDLDTVQTWVDSGRRSVTAEQVRADSRYPYLIHNAGFSVSQKCVGCGGRCRTLSARAD